MENHCLCAMGQLAAKGWLICGSRNSPNILYGSFTKLTIT